MRSEGKPMIQQSLGRPTAGTLRSAPLDISEAWVWQQGSRRPMAAGRQVLQVMGKMPGQGARPPQTTRTSQDARRFGQRSLPEACTGPDGAVNG